MSGTLDASKTAVGQMDGEVNVLGDKVGLFNANVSLQASNDITINNLQGLVA